MKGFSFPYPLLVNKVKILYRILNILKENLELHDCKNENMALVSGIFLDKL